MSACSDSTLSNTPLRRKKENRHAKGGMGGRQAATTQLTGISRKGQGVLLAVAHRLGRLPLPISLRSPSPILAATFMPPRGRPTLVVLPPVASSSVASLSSTSSCCAAAARRSLALSRLLLGATSPSSRRILAPSSLSSSPRARTTLLRPSDAHPDHLPPSHIVAQVHSPFEHLYLQRSVLALGSPSGAS